jgi:hypothetical protein
LSKKQPALLIFTDFFDGAGMEKAVLLRDGKETVYSDINEALSEIGVEADDGKDEFDTIGLGDYHSNEDFFGPTPSRPSNPEIWELIRAHDEGTGLCSFAQHMRNSSPTYQAILARGEAAAPVILQYLKETDGGMNIILLLMDMFPNEKPYTPVTEGGFAKFDVEDCRKAWLEWGGKRHTA